MYKAVIFDFDGTIIDTESHLFEIINKHLKNEKLSPISIEFYRANIGGHAKSLHDYLIKSIGVAKTERIYEEHHHLSQNLNVNDTILKLLKYLKQRHIPMGIATSSYKKDIVPLVEALNLTNYFNVIVGREDVEEVKPSPEPYLTAVQHLNYMPAHCLAIEDSLNGAMAAKTAGLDVIVNTNKMTEVQDFSEIEYSGKDLNYLDIIHSFFKQGDISS